MSVCASVGLSVRPSVQCIAENGGSDPDAIVTNEDFTAMAYVCDSAATRPSSQITLGKLVQIIGTYLTHYLKQHKISGI